MKSAVVCALCVWALAWSPGLMAATADSVAAAKAFYVAAEYEEALKILSAPDDGRATDEVDVYRALCLLALGRMDEVDRALRSLAVRSPTFRMSETDVTPRLVARFQEVRRRAFQDLVVEAYNAAKTSFDAGHYADASSRFDALVTRLSREGSAPDADAAVTRDMVQLARGFKGRADAELARAAKADAPAARPSPRVEVLIEGVVQRYARAFSALDATAVAQVFPGENARSLQRSFSGLKSQAIETRNVRVAVDPDGQNATVTLTWVVEAVPKIGSTVKVQQPTTLRMSKTEVGNWSIVERK